MRYSIRNPNVSVWNKELLLIGGYLARTVYERELADLRALWSPSNQTRDTTNLAREVVQQACLHVLRFFTFHQSTPSPVVSELLEKSFFDCSLPDKDFPILSTAGVLPARRVRLYDSSVTQFLKNTPLLDAMIQRYAPKMVKTLTDRRFITHVIFNDVVAELSGRTLADHEMASCLRWTLDLAERQDVSQEDLKQSFLPVAKFLSNSPKIQRTFYSTTFGNSDFCQC
jgi:hypothetical protein